MREENHSFDRYISDFLGALNSPPSKENTDYFEKAIGKYLPKDRNAKILEIGVGMGHFAYFATKTLQYSNYYGIDISLECIEYVKEHVTDSVELVQETEKWLQLSEKQYDLILALDVIEHIPKPNQIRFLNQIYRSLKSGGAIILRTENSGIFSGYLQHCLDYTHEYNFSERSLEQIMKLCQFNEIQIFGDPPPIQTGVKSLLRKILTAIWRQILKLIYEIERPHSIKPKIMTKNLYAFSKK